MTTAHVAGVPVRNQQTLPGVQPKASASMLSTPLAVRDGRYILKLAPPSHPHFVHNEAMHLAAA